MSTSPESSSTYITTPLDKLKGYLFLVVLFFIWPFTGAWKSSLDYEDTRDIRGKVAATSALGVILYICTAAAIYYGNFRGWLLFIIIAAFFVASFLRLIAQACHDE